jgi:hypothetical protein
VEKISIWRFAGITLLAWLSVVGFDFLLHASLLAPLYEIPSPFLLPPERAFVLIPIGYLSFIIFVILVVWLMVRLKITNWQAGLKFGLIFGALVWAALTISLISISTAPILLMVGWFVGQTIETGLAGLVIGAGLGAEKLWSILIWVSIFVVGSFVLGIVLQNI